VILARREEQLRDAVFLHLQPQACAIRVRQLTHRREDERLQPVDVLLGRQRDSDPVELAELAVAPVRLDFQLGDLLFQRDVLHRDPNQLSQGGR